MSPATQLIPLDGVDARHADTAHRWNTSNTFKGFYLLIFCIRLVRVRARQGKRMFLEALASGESALKMSAAISSARSVFRERELDENAELQVKI